ncbi:MAG: transporter [Xanthobacteraceae bacterium]
MTPTLSALRFFATNGRARSARSHLWLRLGTALFALLVAAACATNSALADEDGVSFWIPGFFGSLAAAPQQPGWSLTSILYNTNVSASGNAAVAREITIGRFNPTINITANANVHADATIGFVAPSYTFATPFLGGQASAILLFGYGNNDTSLNASATATTDIPPLSITRSVALQQDTSGFTDLIPMFTDRWNAGVNNYMVYITGDIPVGLYSSSNLANIGIGHGAIDGGVGYTYFDPKTGHEFSAVAGLTGNFENHSTNYTNGIDFHLDWGASQFLTKQLQVGLVGYFYEQLTGDSGCAPVLCPFESRVIGIGPQIGYIFPVAGMQGYVNLKGYGEFANENRPAGWNVWLTFVLSPAPPTSQSSPPPTLTKTPRS